MSFAPLVIWILQKGVASEKRLERWGWWPGEGEV